jgi:hypothetical protein
LKRHVVINTLGVICCIKTAFNSSASFPANSCTQENDSMIRKSRKCAKPTWAKEHSEQAQREHETRKPSKIYTLAQKSIHFQEKKLISTDRTRNPSVFQQKC